MKEARNSIAGDLRDIWTEGERFARMQALFVTVEAARVAHRLVLGLLLLLLCGVLFLISFFTLLVCFYFSFSDSHEIPSKIVLAFIALLAIGSLSTLIWTMREKHWLHVLQIEKKMLDLGISTKNH